MTHRHLIGASVPLRQIQSGRFFARLVLQPDDLYDKYRARLNVMHSLTGSRKSIDLVLSLRLRPYDNESLGSLL